MVSTHLVVLGNAEATRWVLTNQRMAFSEVGRRTAARLAPGDVMLFYASLKVWPALRAEPRPQGGMFIGSALVLTRISRMRTPAKVGARHFEFGCEIFFELLAPLGQGVAITDVKDQLELTSGKPNYGQVLRRTPILLSRTDSELLTSRLRSTAGPFEENVSQYFANGNVTTGRRPVSKSGEAR